MVAQLSPQPERVLDLRRVWVRTCPEAEVRRSSPHGSEPPQDSVARVARDLRDGIEHEPPDLRTLCNRRPVQFGEQAQAIALGCRLERSRPGCRSGAMR